MREFSISGHDTIPESSLSGESLEYPIPGSVNDVWGWLKDEIRVGHGFYDFYTFGESLLLYREKQVVIIFNDFKRVTDNRSTFRVMFHPDYKRDAFLILSRLAASFGANWEQGAKEILEKTPPSHYSEWIERPGPFPGSIERILAWHEGPPPGWEPPKNIDAGQAETKKYLTLNQADVIVQENLLCIQGWEYERVEQGNTILYIIYNVDTDKKLIGKYHVRQWIDGNIKVGWAAEAFAQDAEINELRNFFNEKMVIPMIIQAQNSVTLGKPNSLSTANQLIQAEKLGEVIAKQESLTPFEQSMGNGENIVADNLGGTLTYKRNEQGQIIITGGTANPGYMFEIGQNSVAIKPERTTIQPPIFEVTSERSKPQLTKWKTIVPNKGDDWQIIELWHNNHTNSEIAERLSKAPRTITNRISTLRLRYPDAGILTANEKRKSLQKP